MKTLLISIFSFLTCGASTLQFDQRARTIINLGQLYYCVDGIQDSYTLDLRIDKKRTDSEEIISRVRSLTSGHTQINSTDELVLISVSGIDLERAQKYLHTLTYESGIVFSCTWPEFPGVSEGN